MKGISLLIPFLLISICVCKDELLQKMYDEVAKNYTQMPNDSYKYVKGLKTKVQTISNIIDKSKISDLKKVGIPEEIVDAIELEDIGTFTQTNITFNETYNMTYVDYHIGCSIGKGNKVRFAYFSVKAEAKIVKELQKKMVRKCSGRRCYNVFEFVEINNLSQEHLSNAFKRIVARMKYELLNKIKALMDLTSDADNFLTNSQLKFLA